MMLGGLLGELKPSQMSDSAAVSLPQLHRDIFLYHWIYAQLMPPAPSDGTGGIIDAFFCVVQSVPHQSIGLLAFNERGGAKNSESE